MSVSYKSFVYKQKKMSLESATGGLRKRTSYTHSLDNIVNLVTLSQKTMPVGSFKYNVHKYVALRLISYAFGDVLTHF